LIKIVDPEVKLEDIDWRKTEDLIEKGILLIA